MVTPKTIVTVCAWHEGKQLPLTNVVDFTHTICPVCTWTYFASVMKHPAPEWPQLLRDGNWTHKPNGSYWGVLCNTASGASEVQGAELEIRHVQDGSEFVLLVDGQPQERGFLTELLELANGWL